MDCRGCDHYRESYDGISWEERCTRKGARCIRLLDREDVNPELVRELMFDGGF